MFENSYMNLYKKKKKAVFNKFKGLLFSKPAYRRKQSRFKNALALEFIREITLDRNVI